MHFDFFQHAVRYWIKFDPDGRYKGPAPECKYILGFVFAVCVYIVDSAIFVFSTGAPIITSRTACHQE